MLEPMPFCVWVACAPQLLQVEGDAGPAQRVGEARGSGGAILRCWAAPASWCPVPVMWCLPPGWPQESGNGKGPGRRKLHKGQLG